MAQAQMKQPGKEHEMSLALEFTDDGIIRHGSFIGLREDKKAKDVGLESANAFTMSDMEGRMKIDCPAKKMQDNIQSLCNDGKDRLQEWSRNGG